MTDTDPPEINGFGRAATPANVSRLLEMKRARSDPAPAPAPPGSSAGKAFGKRSCGSCGKMVGAPGLRHKLDCPEYPGFGKVARARAPESEPEPGGPPPAPSPEPEPEPEPPAPPMTATQSPRLVAEPEPDAAPDPRPDGWPTVAALNAVRSPRLPAVVRVLAKLDDDEAKWVLDALYRISREGRE